MFSRDELYDKLILAEHWDGTSFYNSKDFNFLVMYA